MNKAYWLSAALLVGMTCPALSASQEECTTMWIAADANKDGVISNSEGERYAAAIRVAEREVPAGGISQDYFMENCTEGAFDVASVEPGAPFEGANSFTEGQAQDRVRAAGFSGVSGLKKDDKGIWRGTAKMDGKAANVAVDYKGNVVGQQ